MRFRHTAAAALAVLVAATPLSAQAPNATRGLSVPVEYHKLPNGLKVVLSPDRTTPTTVVGVYYGVGFRNEPKSRTGFAHLFEHLMFQGRTCSSTSCSRDRRTSGRWSSSSSSSRAAAS
jgi:zinc protease